MTKIIATKYPKVAIFSLYVGYLPCEMRWAVSTGINPYGFSVKTTRKTLERWMIATGIFESSVRLRFLHDME